MSDFLMNKMVASKNLKLLQKMTTAILLFLLKKGCVFTQQCARFHSTAQPLLIFDFRILTSKFVLLSHRPLLSVLFPNSTFRIPNSGTCLLKISSKLLIIFGFILSPPFATSIGKNSAFFFQNSHSRPGLSSGKFFTIDKFFQGPDPVFIETGGL
jgi:hypothetical protein